MFRPSGAHCGYPIAVFTPQITLTIFLLVRFVSFCEDVEKASPFKVVAEIVSMHRFVEHMLQLLPRRWLIANIEDVHVYFKARGKGQRQSAYMHFSSSSAIPSNHRNVSFLCAFVCIGVR